MKIGKNLILKFLYLLFLQLFIAWVPVFAGSGESDPDPAKMVLICNPA